MVVAGARGWLSEETMSRLLRTPVFAGVVHHVADASDREIAWLYENCAFTVYPSLYEGWGLPVSESHDFGKVCVTSDRSSLPEAGEGVALLLDPHDRGSWVEQVLRLWEDVEHRVAREGLVRAGHRRVTAQETADTIAHLARRP